MEVFKLFAVAIAGTLWSAWLALYLREKGVNPTREILNRFGRLGWACKVGVLFLVVQMTMFGGAKHGGTNDVDGVTGTNEVEIVGGQSNLTSCAFGLEVGEAASSPLQQRMFSPLKSGETPLLQTDALADFTRGYRLESVSTNDDYSYALPADGAIRGMWHLTGAYEDVQKVSLVPHPSFPIPHHFLFPLGNNLCSSLWAYTWGRVRPQLKNSTNEIVAVGAPMSAIPEVSRFWTMATTNDTYLLTWENFAAGRISGEAESFPLQNGIDPPLTSGEDTASPLTSGETPLPLVSAQIELFRNGDFITRSNNVESVYRRIIEPNPDPLHPYGPVQDLSVINETNAYCWLDIVVAADAWVRFEGDGPSNLVDPSFAAKAGETNHVVILIGKTYKVTCDMEFTVVAKSDPAIDAWREDDRTLWLNWPVTIEAWEGNGKSFMMHVVPNFLGGFFSWTNSCCSVSGSGTHFSYSCDGHCYCTGCAANGYYGYEGYRIGCHGGWCGCSYDPGELEGGESEPEEGPYAPGISVVFSCDAVIFESEFQNLPGLYVGRRSSETVLECLIHGGPNGGTATFTFAGRDRLDGVDLPSSISVPANTRVVRRITYFGLKQSASAEDIVVHGHFQENQGDGDSPPTELDSVAKLTSIRVAFNVDYAAPENDCLDRHLYGVTETVHYHMYPDSAVGTWTFRVGGTEFFPQSGSVFNCPGSLEGLSGGYGSAELSAYGASFRSAFTVFEPQISARNPRINANPLRVSPVVGEAGHLLLYMDMYVEPSYVSFKGLQMREVPDESQSGTHQGYYDDTGKGGNWSHTSNDGAGPWNEVDLHGYYGTDEAGRRGKYDEPWSEGSKEWPIPMDWGRSSMTVGRFRTNPTSQGFVLHANGTFRIEKFNHSAERTISGQAWCDDNPVPR